MSSYILNPDGSVSSKLSGKKVDKTALTRYMKQDDKGHYEDRSKELDPNRILTENYDYWSSRYENAGESDGLPSVTDLTLPLGISGLAGANLGDYVIGRTGKEGDNPEMTKIVVTGANGQNEIKDGVFAKRHHKNFLINPSFGADIHQTFYKSLNNYLFNGEIFATEIEMLAGVDFNSGGLRDVTRFWFIIDYFIEAAVYIGFIEAFLAVEQFFLGSLAKSEYKNVDSNVLDSFSMQLGNYGPVSYTKMSYFINEVLQYPKTNKSQGALDRIGAFYAGLALYINSDPQILWDKFRLKDGFNELLKGGSFSPLTEIFGYFLDSLFTLTNIGEKKLIALIRRFHQKSWWHKNILYKSKSLSITKENTFESYLAELSYYYVKFAIERMHVGLKFKNYRRRNKTKGLLNRSGRVRESIYRFSNRPQGNITLEGKFNKGVLEKYYHRQSMSASLMPQSFILPESLIRSFYLNKSNAKGEDFVEAHVMQYFHKTKKRQQRLSKESVKLLESFYEKEMVPFYFHDMRTNEVIGFHAFIESLTDNFNVNYNSTKGFGRVDDVMHYVDTKRNISLTFMLAATSKEDHDFIWYQINKLVSMCYPQWSDGYTVSKTNDSGETHLDYAKMSYPFSQVPTASPLIRLRVGDIIKSNYSQHAISKIHGVGNFEWSVDNIIKDKIHLSDDVKHYLLPGTYFNQIRQEEVIVNELISLDDVFLEKEKIKEQIAASYKAKSESKEEAVKRIKALEEIAVSAEASNKATTIWESPPSFIEYKIENERIEKSVEEKYTKISFVYDEVITSNRLYHMANPHGEGAFDTEDAVTTNKRQIAIFTIDNLSIVTYYPLFKSDGNKLKEQKKYAQPWKNPGSDSLETENMTGQEFLTMMQGISSTYTKPFETDREGNPQSLNNPITAAYETSSGKGLAGFITMMDLNTQDQTWETEVVGSKAPKTIKVSINFSPIHDIQPGLDADGAMRAPVYNTGRIINKLYGDD